MGDEKDLACSPSNVVHLRSDQTPHEVRGICGLVTVPWPGRVGLGRKLGRLKFSSQTAGRFKGAKANTRANQPGTATVKRSLSPMLIWSAWSRLAWRRAPSSWTSTQLDSFRHLRPGVDLTQSQGVPQKVFDAMLTAGTKSQPHRPRRPCRRRRSLRTRARSKWFTKSTKTKSSAPDLHKIRKVLFEMEWADDDNARPARPSPLRNTPAYESSIRRRPRMPVSIGRIRD